ncbi:MAG: tetratricopeptide repeat protein [Deltaproteobacteria bacterium]|nr:tetratricopeptide repeat protein [Deltaproteobacteria bacterium]
MPPLLLLAALLACAHVRVPDVDPVRLVAPLLGSVPAYPAHVPDAALVEDAAARRLRGDLEGARGVLAFVLARETPSPAEAEALYQLGLCYEAEEETEVALAVYDRLVRTFPDAPVSQDGWFRRALCLESLGAHRQAVRSLERIRTSQGLDRHDRYTLDLQRGISLVRSGRRNKGLRLLDDALAATSDTEEVTYLRAKAYLTRARVWAEAAARIRFTGPDRRQARRLEERATYLRHAEAEVTAATALKEPEWILEGLLLLGRAYEDLRSDLLQASPPRGFSEEGVARWQAELETRTRILGTKAWRHYDEGVALAGRLGWVGRPLAELRAARAAIRLEALVKPPASDAPPAEHASESDQSLPL